MEGKEEVGIAALDPGVGEGGWTGDGFCGPWE